MFCKWCGGHLTDHDFPCPECGKTQGPLSGGNNFSRILSPQERIKSPAENSDLSQISHHRDEKRKIPPILQKSHEESDSAEIKKDKISEKNEKQPGRNSAVGAVVQEIGAAFSRGLLFASRKQQRIAQSTKAETQERPVHSEVITPQRKESCENFDSQTRDTQLSATETSDSILTGEEKLFMIEEKPVWAPSFVLYSLHGRIPSADRVNYVWEISGNQEGSWSKIASNSQSLMLPASDHLQCRLKCNGEKHSYYSFSELAHPENLALPFKIQIDEEIANRDGVTYEFSPSEVKSAHCRAFWEVKLPSGQWSCLGNQNASPICSILNLEHRLHVISFWQITVERIEKETSKRNA